MDDNAAHADSVLPRAARVRRRSRPCRTGLANAAHEAVRSSPSRGATQSHLQLHAFDGDQRLAARYRFADLVCARGSSLPGMRRADHDPARRRPRREFGIGDPTRLVDASGRPCEYLALAVMARARNAPAFPDLPQNLPAIVGVAAGRDFIFAVINAQSQMRAPARQSRYRGRSRRWLILKLIVSFSSDRWSRGFRHAEGDVAELPEAERRGDQQRVPRGPRPSPGAPASKHVA